MIYFIAPYGKRQEKNKEIIRIHSDTEKSMPKEKRNWMNFFLDMMVWPGYNGLMNGGEWLLAVRPLGFLIRSRVCLTSRKFSTSSKKVLDIRFRPGYNEPIKNEAGQLARSRWQKERWDHPSWSEKLWVTKKVLDIRNTVRYNEGIKSKGLTSWRLIPWSRKFSGTKKVLDSQSTTWYNELIKNGLVRLACSSLIIEYERVI